MLSQVSRKYGVVISVGELFQGPTIQQLAEKILNAKWATHRIDEPEMDYEKIKI